MIPEAPATLAVAPDVALEARLAVPARAPAGVVVCHPHPLYGGDMDNPVVVRVQQVCAELGLATLRFNFRGVSESSGTHGGGVGEQDDATAALDALAQATGTGPLAIAGYSFGAWVAALVGCRDARVTALALIAPPLAMYDFGGLEGKRVPTLAVAGTADPYCPAGDFQRFTARFAWVTPALIEGADHFFFGKLYPLGTAVGGWAREWILAGPRRRASE
jgi:alpha/beta superfamily hydrolase